MSFFCQHTWEREGRGGKEERRRGGGEEGRRVKGKVYGNSNGVLPTCHTRSMCFPLLVVDL